MDYAELNKNCHDVHVAQIVHFKHQTNTHKNLAEMDKSCIVLSFF